jgi:hypothetical protein
VIRIAITEAAFNVIADTLPFGSTMYETKASNDGGYFIWLERHAMDQLYALRQRGEDLSDVIVRLAAMEKQWPGKRRWRLKGGVAHQSKRLARASKTGRTSPR